MSDLAKMWIDDLSFRRTFRDEALKWFPAAEPGPQRFVVPGRLEVVDEAVAPGETLDLVRGKDWTVEG